MDEINSDKHPAMSSFNAPIDPRVLLAAERTLLAWIRTGLAMMGFGFVVARFGLFLRELAIARQLTVAPHTHLSLWVGTALVLLGVVTTLAAAIHHIQFLNRLARGEPPRAGIFSLAVLLSGILAVIGIAMAGYLVAMR